MTSGTDKEVRLILRSVIQNLTEDGTPDGAPEQTRLTLPGRLCAEGDAVILTYEEPGEGGTIHCRVTLRGDTVVVRRQGAVMCEMVFSPEEYRGIYEVPPYRFDMTVRTRKIRAALTPEGGELDLFYSLTVGGAPKHVHLHLHTADEEACLGTC